VDGNAFEDLMDEKTRTAYRNMRKQQPRTWQYRCLMFQESMLATGIVCGLVLFELIYVSSLDGEAQGRGRFSDQILWGAVITVFFLAEIALRFYTWFATMSTFAETRGTIGGFFTNPFRLVDTTLVLVDVVLLGVALAVPQSSAGSTKAAVKVGMRKEPLLGDRT